MPTDLECFTSTYFERQKWKAEFNHSQENIGSISNTDRGAELGFYPPSELCPLGELSGEALWLHNS